MMSYPEINPEINYERSNQRWNGWGASDQDYFHVEYIEEILNLLRKQLKMAALPDTPSVEISEIKLKKPNLTAPQLSSLKKIVGADQVLLDEHERILHSAGRSYFDVLRLRTNKLTSFVDAVVYPQNEKQVKAILEWAQQQNCAVVPYGGGSSVVGGVEALKSKQHKAVVSLDLTLMASLLSIDKESYTASFEAGIYGPKLEQLLQNQGFTLGHFPQSFEYSTLGGWIAARGAGQQSNRYGKVEEMVTSVKVVTPKATLKTHEFPHPAIGPDLKQTLIGSEGLFGVITSAGVKISKIPEQRLYVAFIVKDFTAGANIIKAIHHQNIDTAMARLSDETETRLYELLGKVGKKKSALKNILQSLVLKTKGLSSQRCVLLVGFEGKKADNQSSLQKIKKIVKQHRGLYAGSSLGQRWLKGRFNMPFLRNYILDYGIAIDTFETSCLYSKVEEVHEKVYHNLKGFLPNSAIMCHISHNYHEGACLYFTIIYAMDNDPIRQWQKMKTIASDTLVECGAAISHHHGVGVDHKKWYLKQTDSASIESLRKVKEALDPKGILNPGKVFF